MVRKVLGISMIIYTAISLAVSLGFLFGARAVGQHPAVAMYGGAAWVFLLSMIVTMPLVTARVKRWHGTGG